MARRRREDYDGAWWHLFHRGLAKRTVFETSRDVRCGNELRQNELRRGVYSRWSWLCFVASVRLILVIRYSALVLICVGFGLPRVNRCRCLNCGHRDERRAGRNRVRETVEEALDQGSEDP